MTGAAPDTLGPRRILGVLVPYFNTVVQPELDDLRPDGVTNQTARFTLDAKVLEDLAAVAERLVACGPQALLVALATESFPNGLATLRRAADDLAARSGLPVFTASHATQAALRGLGASRLGVVTPFDDAANARVREAFEAAGFTVASIAGLGCSDLAAIGRSSAADVHRVFDEVDRPVVEALVQVGTGLPVLRLVEELERARRKPVVACNAALYWQALRETGIADKIRGFGRLLAEL
jgi:maleate isomerase